MTACANLRFAWLQPYCSVIILFYVSTTIERLCELTFTGLQPLTYLLLTGVQCVNLLIYRSRMCELTFYRSTRSHRAPPSWPYTRGNTLTARKAPSESPGRAPCVCTAYMLGLRNQYKTFQQHQVGYLDQCLIDYFGSCPYHRMSGIELLCRPNI